MSKCYKCGTGKELSKRGKTVMICKPCRRLEYYRYKGLIPPEQRPVKVVVPKVIIHKCSKCGTVENVSSNKQRQNKLRWKCEHCISKVNGTLALPKQLATPEWMARAAASYKKVLEYRT